MFYSSAYLRERKGRGWIGVLSYKDESGKWRKREKSLEAKGKRAAEKELKEWHSEMEKAALEPALLMPAETVIDYVTGYVKTLETSKTIEKSTVTFYRAMLNYIDDGLGAFKLEELKADSAQAWVNKMSEDGYAATTVRKAFNLLKAAMNNAEATGRIVKNPLRTVKLPKIVKKEPNALDSSQRARLISFLDIAAPTPVNLGVRLALFTGMREGEICGLKWQNVIFNAGDNMGIIKVRTVIGRDGGKTYEKEPKTGGSRRDIPITESLVEALKQRHAEMASQCLEAGIPFSNDLYVLGRVDGANLSPHGLWEAWKAIATSLGLVGTQGKEPSFHDLRHTFATTAISEGVDVKSVSSILGHTNAAMTLNIYASADPDAKRRAAKTVSEALERKPKDARIIQLKTGTDDE